VIKVTSGGQQKRTGERMVPIPTFVYPDEQQLKCADRKDQ